MLNISDYSIEPFIEKSRYSIFGKLENRSVSTFLLRIVVLTFLIAVGAMFLPWTQHIRTSGYVTTLNPNERPQAIQSLIGGRIEEWFVQEGDLVMEGDTILRITEAQEDYFDPELLTRTQNQVNAKNRAAEAYGEKAGRLTEQYRATLENKEVKLEQNELEIDQVKFELASDSIGLEAAIVNEDNARKQWDRTSQLYAKGIKSLTELELKKGSFENARAKVVELENKMAASKTKIRNLITNREFIINDFDEKLSKIQAERMSSLSSQYTAEGDANKLQSMYNQYKVRSDAYFVRSPIQGYITKAVQTGIGEFIKAGEDIVTIIPADFRMAVEIYVPPRDMPLLRRGQQVRLMFDGWPAIIFSGWPNNSYGTFDGTIFAIDNFISDNGRYRILVVENPDEMTWPREVRVGGGANALILLKDVKVYYELWRQLNGFPPDFYVESPAEEAKLKPPMRKIK